MKALIASVELKNRQTGAYEPADLFEGIDQQNLLDFEREWQPAFAAQVSSDASAVERIAANAEDAHWDWRRLAEIGANPLAYGIFAVECAGKTQGLMLVRKGSAFSRHPDHEHADLIYVDRLSTAPWNRPTLTETPLYKGVGQLLVGAAVNLSLDEELGGRIALHSLPGAESFYRDIVGMTDLGADIQKQGLQYFELSSAQAAKFFDQAE
jgi:hypothetical protein